MAGKEAARMGDKAKHNGPHCHMPMHPPAPVPTPQPHSCLGHPVVLNCAPTVMINNKMAATVTSQVPTCQGENMCVPGGPGMVAMGAFTVLICNMPAGRKDDMVAFTSCVGPIPMPLGKIDDACSSDVKIG